MSNLVLTPDQQASVDGILRDIKEPGARVVLCGYAGTGKTVTTAALVSSLRSIGMNVAVATPTHKAKVQVEKALRDRGARGFLCVTLHAMLGLKPRIDYKTGSVEFLPDYGSDNMLACRSSKELYNYETGETEIKHPIEIVIVDETSMVNRFLYDLLLKELDDRPVVFVGDDRQLLPVKEDKVCPAFVEAQSIYRLDDVLRHDGAILHLATQTRKLPIGRAIFKSCSSGGSQVVAYRRRQQWMDALLDEMRKPQAMDDPDHCRALAWINKDVQALNKAIHIARYGENAPRFLAGMTCVTVDAIPNPFGGRPLLNSTMDVLILSAEEEDFTAPYDETINAQSWKTWTLEVEVCGLTGLTEIRVMHEDDLDRWKESQKKFAEKAKICSDSAERKNWWDMYWKRSDQFGKLEPASALTIHKSQGSTFKNVFLHWDIDGWGSAPTAQQNQLSYVGITRAAESLHVVADR